MIGPAPGLERGFTVIVCVCVRACVRACVTACVSVCVHVCVHVAGPRTGSASRMPLPGTRADGGRTGAAGLPSYEAMPRSTRGEYTGAGWSPVVGGGRRSTTR